MKTNSTHGLTATELQTLTSTCLEAKTRAYCPYSHFRVGCTILLTNGSYITGANVENAAYPVGSCAERVALGTAVVSEGIRRGDVKAVGVSTDLEEEEGKGPASPCGMCRQALREFCDLTVPIFMYYKDGTYVVKTLNELLPMSFGPDMLPPPQELPNYS